MKSAAQSVLLALLLALLAGTHDSGVAATEDECARTAHMQIYSATFVSKETGDLDGYELALKPGEDSIVEALLYVYEGASNDDGIPLSGRISGNSLTIEGTWNEHQIEYPSKTEIVVKHFIRIAGTLDSSWFRGTLKIEGLDTPPNVKLKRIAHIWTCRHSG